MNNEQLLEEAEKLIWALLDDRIEEADTQHLEKLLKENDQVRARYLEISQVHADLYSHFGSAQANTQSPVLGFLGDFSTTPASNVPQAE